MTSTNTPCSLQDDRQERRRIRAISLDIDGVLHPADAFDEDSDRSDPKSAQELGLMRWLPLLAALLADHEDVMLLVHSGWRQSVPEEEIQELMAPVAKWYRGITSAETMQRYDSIREAVQRLGIDDLLAIDDVAREFPIGWKSLLVCDSQLGISQEIAQARIAAWLKETRQP